MKTIFVIGNGESRKGVDLEQLRRYGTIWGCNALYRDFTPDHLVSVDEDMNKEIATSGYGDEHSVFVRFIEHFRPVENMHVKKVIPDRGFASGPTALYLACKTLSCPAQVFLVGHDLYGVGPERNRHNNVYKGTMNYREADASATYNLNWIRQLAAIFAEHPGISFWRVGEVNDPVPDEWVDNPNVRFIDFDEMFSIFKAKQ